IETVKKEKFEVVNENINKREKFPFSLQVKRIDKVGYGDIDDYTFIFGKLRKNIMEIMTVGKLLLKPNKNACR
ncbi:MAG: hypothetical protein KBS93_02535, partial [Flavobacteriaceae bacterium]|nr:hypothetical protein [Candidatus Onthonaster equi]